LLNYDLAKEKGIVLSLLQSHISQFNKDASPHSIWCEILVEVQNFNQNAGTITLDTLSDDLVEYFKPKGCTLKVSSFFLVLLEQKLPSSTSLINSAASDVWGKKLNNNHNKEQIVCRSYSSCLE
jgi:hypothetical protein